MTEEKLKKHKKVNLTHQMMLDYQNYLKQRKLLKNKKTVFLYKETQLAFTPKQIKILKFIAKGFSNIKIAQSLMMKEPTIKILVYRLMKYLEGVLCEHVDRYHLIIIAQEMNLEGGLCMNKGLPRGHGL